MGNEGERVYKREWKICTYEMATYVAFWWVAHVLAVSNRCYRMRTPCRWL